MIDTPTNNFATLNPLDKHPSQPLSNGNLVLTNNGWDTSYKIGGTIAFDPMDGSGFYYEVKMNSHADNTVQGFCNTSINLINETNYPYQTSGFW
jgi:hypothetical protein